MIPGFKMLWGHLIFFCTGAEYFILSLDWPRDWMPSVSTWALLPTGIRIGC